MAGVEEWMVPWVARGERVLRHRFPLLRLAGRGMAIRWLLVQAEPGPI